MAADFSGAGGEHRADDCLHGADHALAVARVREEGGAVTPKLTDIWVYLSASPLLGLTVTLVLYQGAYWIYRRANFYPLLNPVGLSVAALVLILTLTHTPYQTYFDGAQFVHFLLGPATVALAIPLYAQFDKLKRAFLPLLSALMVGAVVAITSAVGTSR